MFQHFTYILSFTFSMHGTQKAVLCVHKIQCAKSFKEHSTFRRSQRLTAIKVFKYKHKLSRHKKPSRAYQVNGLMAKVILKPMKNLNTSVKGNHPPHYKDL